MFKAIFNFGYHSYVFHVFRLDQVIQSEHDMEFILFLGSLKSLLDSDCRDFDNN